MGTICSKGTKYLGTIFSWGLNLMGTVCPGGSILSRGTGSGGPEVQGSNGFKANCIAALYTVFRHIVFSLEYFPPSEETIQVFITSEKN